MDRFVWFVLLVVISHLVTEFTRVTGYTRGPRQDLVMVNDSSIQPIRVQNLVLYPGQEYGLYEQQNQQYYNGNNLYANNNKNHKTNNNNNFLSNLFNQITSNMNSNNNNNNNFNNNNNPNEQQSGSNNNILLPSEQGDVRTFSFRPIIDSIFEIPISTLRAVNNLVGRLTGSYQQTSPQQQQQQQNPEQQPHHIIPQYQPPKYSSYPMYQTSASSAASASATTYYGMQRSAGTIQPKTQYEMLNRIQQQQQQSQKQQQQPTTVAPSVTTKETNPVGATPRKSQTFNEGLKY